MSATGKSLYFKDDRVLYQESEGAKEACRGVITHEVEGGETPRYAVKNEQTHKETVVSEDRILRRV